MDLRDHPQLRDQWPPRRLADRAFPGAPLPDTAVLLRVEDVPPFQALGGVQGVVLTTDAGAAVIRATNARFRAALFQTLSAAVGLSLREIGMIAVPY